MINFTIILVSFFTFFYVLKRNLAYFKGSYSLIGSIGQKYAEVKIRINLYTVTICAVENGQRLGHFVVKEEKINTLSFVRMTKKEVEAEYKNRSKYLDRTIGFKSKNKSMVLLFLKDPTKEEYGLVVRQTSKNGLLSGYLFGSLFYSPDQIKLGYFQDKIEELEEEYGKGVVLRVDDFPSK